MSLRLASSSRIAVLSAFFIVAGCGSTTPLDGGGDMNGNRNPAPDLAGLDSAAPPDLSVPPDLALSPPDLAIPSPIVFADDYAPGVSFTDFGGAINDVAVDMAEKHSGTASLRINVPHGAFTGGALKSARPWNLSGYTAVTFWAKASKGPILFDTFGLGNDGSDTKFFAEWHTVTLTTTWTKFIIPLPQAGKLVAQDGLFHFGQAGNGPYSVWVDDVQYENVPANVLGDAVSYIATENIMKSVGDAYDVVGALAVWMINSMPVTVVIGNPYLSFASSNAQVATVDGSGHVLAVGAGTTIITAKLGAIDTAGTLTVNVTKPVSMIAPINAPARPVLAQKGVISLLSNAYVNVPVDTWLTGWSNSKEMDVKIAGDDMKRYFNLVFAGVETVAQPIDATAMTTFHMDVWTADSTVFKIKLVDFGADGKFAGGDDTEHELSFDANSNPKLVTQAWIGFELPLALFTNLKARAHMAQFIFSGSVSSAWVDNVYFHN